MQFHIINLIVLVSNGKTIVDTIWYKYTVATNTQILDLNYSTGGAPSDHIHSLQQ